jgi:AcrR family transcriptional regulator
MSGLNGRHVNKGSPSGPSPQHGVTGSSTDETNRAQDAASGGTRVGGRRLSVSVNEAIISATVELLADGVNAVTIERVASHAGVGKNAVYRRWPSKQAVIIATMERLADSSIVAPVVETCNVRDDLVAALKRFIWALTESPLSQIIPAVVGAMRFDAELARAFRQGFVEHRRALLAKIIQRGIDSGQLRGDTDMDMILDVGAGFLYNRLIIEGRVAEADLAERFIDLLMRGIGGADD